jgi:hypothetical protein
MLSGIIVSRIACVLVILAVVYACKDKNQKSTASDVKTETPVSASLAGAVAYAGSTDSTAVNTDGGYASLDVMVAVLDQQHALLNYSDADFAAIADAAGASAFADVCAVTATTGPVTTTSTVLSTSASTSMPTVSTVLSTAATISTISTVPIGK